MDGGDSINMPLSSFLLQTFFCIPQLEKIVQQINSCPI